MKQNLLLILLIFYSLLYSQNISLDQAINSALQKNEKILQFKAKLNQKEANLSESWGNYLPKIDLNASYTYMDDPLQMSLAPIRDAIYAGSTITKYSNDRRLNGLDATTMAGIMGYLSNPSSFEGIYGTTKANQIKDLLSSKGITSNELSPYFDAILPNSKFNSILKERSFPTVNFTLVQPLFTGFKISAGKNAATADLEASKAELEKTQNEIVQEVVTNYLNVVLASEVVKTRKAVLAGMVSHRSRAKRMLEEGMIANYNYLRAEVAVADAERNLSDDQNKLELAKLALATSMGTDEAENIQISDTLAFKNITFEIPNLINKAHAAQPILKLIEQKKEMAHQKYIAERSNLMPTVAAFGKYELSQHYLSALEPNWAVGVQASLNIFSGLKDKAKMESAEYLEQEVMYLHADTKRKISLLINKTYRDYVNAKDKYNKLQTNISLANENLRYSEKRFETGMGTSLEVIDAQLVLEKNLIDSKVALYEYYKSINEIGVTIGEPVNILSVWNSKEK